MKSELINAYIGRIIEKKYGIGHARVYRILRDKGQLEEKQIIEYCLLPLQFVRKIIEVLFKDGIIQHIELTTKSGAIMRFYSVKEDDATEKIIRLTYKAIANVLIKLNHEDLEEKEDIRIANKEVLKGCATETAELLMILSSY